MGKSTWRLPALFLFVGLSTTRADVVLTTAGQEKTFRHDSLSYQLFDKVGLGPGSSVGPLPVGIWDERDEEHLCEITDQTFYSPLEEIMEIPVDKYRELRKNQIVIYPNPFAVVNCSKVQRSLLVVWTLPILIRFWDAHFLFVTPENRSATNPFFSRSIVSNQFDSEYYRQASKAYLISEASDELLAFLAEVQELPQTLVNSTASILEIDSNPLLEIFDSILYRFVFQGIFVVGFLAAGIANVRILWKRYKAPKLKTTQRIYKVLGINIFLPLASAILLAIDGYTSRGNLSANWQHSFRTMFFGLNSAADFLIGAYWLNVVQKSSITSLKKRRSGTNYIEKVMSFIPILLASLDIFTFLGFLALDVKWEILYTAVPAVCLPFQLFIIFFMLWSTKKILHLIDSTETSTAKKKKRALVQKAIMRRLAFWMRITSACSGVFVIVFLCIALQTFYVQSLFLYVFINASLVVARLGGIFAKGQFCAPPPRVKVHPGQYTAGDGTSSTSTSSTNSASDS